MTAPRHGERLFRAWHDVPPPAFDEGPGRARLLERLAAGRAPSRWPLALAAAAVVVMGLAGVGAWRAAAAVRFTTASGEGHAGAWLATSRADELPLTFSEGSRLVMAPDSRGRVEELRRTGATFLLERGRVRARVTHAAGTDWRFLAGPFEVRVTGTSLGVEWDPARERFAVRVDEGSVAVQGPNVGEPQVVVAGQECAVDLTSRTMHIGPAGAEARGTADSAIDAGGEVFLQATGSAASSPGAGRPSVPASGPSWAKLADKGDYEGAYAAASMAGLPSVLRSASGDELLRFAQVARLSGHRDAARDALVACRRRFPGSERASIAAYELGQASSPIEAQGWFETYLREQPGGSLAREAAGRLVEARAASGDEPGARDAASRYLARYPGGPHAALARRILSGAGE